MTESKNKLARLISGEITEIPLDYYRGMRYSPEQECIYVVWYKDIDMDIVTLTIRYKLTDDSVLQMIQEGI